MEEGSRAFARVYEYTAGPGLDLAKTNGVISFVHTESGGFFAEEATSDDYDFVNAHENEGWKFLAFDLTDPAWIEKITSTFEAMKSRGGKWQYELYERMTQVAVVRSPNPDYVPHVEVSVTSHAVDADDWNICPRTGQPHRFIKPTPQIPIIGLPYGINASCICSTCHGIFYTSKLSGK